MMLRCSPVHSRFPGTRVLWVHEINFLGIVSAVCYTPHKLIEFTMPQLAPRIIVSTVLALLVAAVIHFDVMLLYERSRALCDSSPSVPRMLVKADYDWHGYFDIDTDAIRLGVSPLIGRSIWWEKDDWQKLIDERAESASSLQPFEGRPAPPPEITKARCFHPGQELPVAVFWREGEDGMHTISRIEARGSSEDVPREGELRTSGELYADSTYGYVDSVRRGEQLVPAPFAHVFIETRYVAGSVRFHPTRSERKLLRRWGHGHTDPDYVMEVLLPPGKSPVARQIFIDGHPYEEGLEYMRRGEFPPHRPLKKASPSDSKH